MKNNMKLYAVRITAIILLISVFSMFTSLAFAKVERRTLYDQVYGDNPPQKIDTDATFYMEYLEENNSNDYTGKDIVGDINDAKVSSKGNHVKEYQGKQAISWKNDGIDDDIESITWEMTVPEDAYYNITVEFFTLEGSNMPPQRILKINDEILFEEMRVFNFNRKFVDVGEFWVNELGDQVRPAAEEVQEWKKIELFDNQGDFSEAIRFYLSKGTHKITFEHNNGGMLIAGIALTAPLQYKPYAEVIKEYKAQGIQEYDGKDIINIQAEKPYDKSDSSLRAQASNDPRCVPENKGYAVYNTIGAKSWTAGGSRVSWEIVAPKTGLYKVAMRYYQDYTNGLPIYRKIEVNNKVPYAEFLAHKFDKSNWTYKDIRNNVTSEPYLIMLNEGKNTLSMTSVRGESVEIITKLKKTSYALGEIVQSIRKITTLDIDINFDYKLFEKIPTLEYSLKEIDASISEQIDDIIRISGNDPNATNNLKMTQHQIARMLENPFVIPRGLNGLVDAQGNMSQWITDFQDCSLEIDYINIVSPSVETIDYSSNLWEQFTSIMRTFFVSFVRDYDMMGNLDDSVSSLNIWLARSKEWAEVLQIMMDEEFSSVKNVNAVMSVVPPGSFSTSGILMLAIASGNAPDVALGVGAGVPYEYGVRGAVEDLTHFDTYEEVKERFLPGILTPFMHHGEQYAFPETMNFNVLYYRTDIMNSLNLSVPNTWGELQATIIPILKKNGMDFFYDGSIAAATGSISPMFHAFLIQNGGAYYSEDGRRSALGSPEGHKAFKDFTEMYTIHGMPETVEFYNRFRIGLIPIGVSSFDAFIRLTAAAPEITGKWDVAPIPGIYQDDGQINRSYGGNTESVIMLKDSQNKQKAWEFIDWYTSTRAQVRYANEITAAIGAEARWASANLEAFDSLSWETNLKKAVVGQREWYSDIPNVIGGYITPRHLENARIGVIIQGKSSRDMLERAVKRINLELDKKNEEFERREKAEAE